VRKKARPRRFLCYQQRSRERYVRVPTPAQEERRRNTEDRRNISPAPIVRGQACRLFESVDKHAERTRNLFGPRALFDNHGSRSHAGEHTSAQATVAYPEREQLKQSERYAVLGYPSWQPVSLQRWVLCRSNCRRRSQPPPNNPSLHTD
jgi:hypothetical protein